MGVNNNGSGQTKADLLLTKVDKLAQQNRTLDAKVEQLARQNQTVVAQIAQQSNSVSAHVGKISQVNGTVGAQISRLEAGQKSTDEKLATLSSKLQDVLDSGIDRDMDRDAIMLKMDADKKELIQEIEYLSAQQQSMYRDAVKPAEKPAEVSVDLDELAAKVADKITVPANEINYEVLAAEIAKQLPQIDYGELGSKVVENMYIPSAIVEELDYDALAEKLAAKMTVATPEIDYDALADKVAARLYIPQAVVEELDYDALAKKLSEYLPAEEAVSSDDIASKVADQLIDPAVDAQTIAEKVAEALAGKIDISVDSEEVADRIAKQVGTITPEQFDVMVDEDGCDSLAKAVESKLNYENISSSVAEKLAANTLNAEVDSEEIARAVAEKLNVGQINEDTIAEKAASALSNYVPEIDTEELAEKVAAAIPAPDSEALAAAVAQKIAEGQADKDFDIVVDEEGVGKLCTAVSEKLSEDLAADRDIVMDEEGLNAVSDAVAHSYDEYFNKLEQDVADLKALASAPEADEEVVIDEDGVEELTSQVAQKVKGEYDERLENIQKQIEEIKAMLAAGVVAAVASDEIAPAAAQAIEEEPVEEATEETEEQVEEPAEEVAEETEEQVEEPAEEAAEETEEQVEEPVEEVTEETEEQAEEPVEEVTEETEEQVEEPAEEVTEETEEQVEEPAEEATEETEEEEKLVTVSDVVEGEPEVADEEDEVIGEIVEDIDENPSEGEIMPDGLPATANGGVDFANMMKYNRSFIARIIQSTDDQKRYYGQVKNALLAYKKVNSNIAWGAERFNKGRETIARFKIRGKTLCLYLALDPNEFETSVYHHTDVSDNKSMHGTPMMVKIKSPRGVKKAIRLVDIMLERRNGIKREIAERDYAAMYPYETIEELIEEGLVKDVSKNK
ncbi:MAG TPA: hypothetical protein IAB94_01330 [Candidatus Coproplasma avicola]|uniref:Uncharacterized protein n=1 Tax=Candidatus Coproplasma avicola TaxID=2840744 RepID=A0A9D1E5M4_9FIRM|nr:hypothetical protein [Candidatus Coproplasma avicola]